MMQDMSSRMSAMFGSQTTRNDAGKHSDGPVCTIGFFLSFSFDCCLF